MLWQATCTTFIHTSGWAMTLWHIVYSRTRMSYAYTSTGVLPFLVHVQNTVVPSFKHTGLCTYTWQLRRSMWRRDNRYIDTFDLVVLVSRSDERCVFQHTIQNPQGVIHTCTRSILFGSPAHAIKSYEISAVERGGIVINLPPAQPCGVLQVYCLL